METPHRCGRIESPARATHGSCRGWARETAFPGLREGVDCAEPSNGLPRGRRRQMKPYAVLLFSLMLAACGAAPIVEQPDRLFNDNLFFATSERISADDIFALSDEMKHYLGTEIASEWRAKSRQQGLFD